MLNPTTRWKRSATIHRTRQRCASLDIVACVHAHVVDGVPLCVHQGESLSALLTRAGVERDALEKASSELDQQCGIKTTTQLWDVLEWGDDASKAKLKAILRDAPVATLRRLRSGSCGRG
jgi:hypothetical protein